MELHPRVVVLLSIILVLAFWLADSGIHFFLYGEPTFQMIPQDINELWMRSVISLLIVMMGLMIARSRATRQLANTAQANSNGHRGEVRSVIVRLHHLALGVETNELTLEEFYVLAKAAIQANVEELMTER